MFTIPYIATIFLIVITLWIVAVRGLGRIVKHSIDTPTMKKDPKSDIEPKDIDSGHLSSARIIPPSSSSALPSA